MASYYGGSDVRLAPDDLILHVNKIDHGLGRSNPLDQVTQGVRCMCTS